MAGELGFEPRLAESESAVLPLDDSPKFSAGLYSNCSKDSNYIDTGGEKYDLHSRNHSSYLTLCSKSKGFIVDINQFAFFDILSIVYSTCFNVTGIALI
jgi:hypothetical protein